MNPHEYSYTGEELVTIKAKELNLLKVAVEQAIENATVRMFDEKTDWLDEEGNTVENPSKEGIAYGKVRQVTNIRETFNTSNIRTSYDPNRLTQEMLMAQELLLDIHLRNITEGVAKPINELIDVKAN